MINNGPGGRSRLQQEDEQPSSGWDFGVLDPGRQDPGYWDRFRTSLLTRASGELARRREMAQVTVMDLALSWARVMVPAAAVAAALGAVLLSGGRPEAARLDAGPEEVLTRGLEDRTFPEFMALDDEDEGVFLLAGGSY